MSRHLVSVGRLRGAGSALAAMATALLVACGGGSPMDAAKLIWVLYEHPDVHFEDLALRFMDIRKRIVRFPRLGRKAKFIAIPTTSGTGSEVTAFTVIGTTFAGSCRQWPSTEGAKSTSEMKPSSKYWKTAGRQHD